MTTPALYNCHNCGRQYNIKVLKQCPVCQTSYQYVHTPPAPTEEVTRTAPARASSSKAVSSPTPAPTPAAQPTTQAVAQSWSPQKLNFARNASASASTVDLYGQIIQIVGYVLAIFTAIYFWFIWGPDNDSNLAGFIIGIIAGALTAWGYQVVGALYRMIANYILFRTTQ
jgi:hypothetical protein